MDVGTVAPITGRDLARVEEKFATAMAAIKEVIAIREALTSRAFEKSEVYVEARFAALNNLKEQLHERENKYVSYDKYDGAIAELGRRLHDLERFRAGEAGRHVGVATVIVILTLLVNAAGLYLQARS